MKQNKLISKIGFLVLIIFSLTPILWFINREGIILNGSDTNFPLDPLVWISRRLYVWDSFSNAGQSFAAGISGLFFHFIQLIPFLLKFNLQGVQIISLVFWFTLIVFSSYSLSRLLFKNSFFAQLVFVSLYTFNIYLFNTWEVAKVTNLSLVVSIPLALSVIIKLREKSISTSKATLFSFVIGMILSGSGINPAYFICFFVVMAVFLVVDLVFSKSEKVLGICKDYLRVIFPIVIFNLFWIIPTIVYIRSSIGAEGSIAQIGYTNWLDSLSQNTSLFNVARLQGAWDWYSFDDSSGMPLYIPYALNYFKKTPFIVFSLLGFGLALLSLSLKTTEYRERKFKIIFSILLILGLFLGTGSHSPTGVIYIWLTKHVPFFSLFRSPWYIFTPLATLSLAGLVSFLFYRIVNKNLAILLSTIFIVGNLIYSYPLITGKIFRPSMSDNFYIKFPQYVFDSFEYLNSISSKGRILGYPGDEIERFGWGYNGIDSILGLGTNKELLFGTLNPDSYLVSKLISNYYRNLIRGETSLANNIASKLNLSMIFEKKDQSTLALDLDSEVKKYLKASFGEWNFYEIPKEYQTDKIFIADSFVFIEPFDYGQKALGLMNGRGIFLRSKDDIVKNISVIQSLASHVILARNEQSQDYQEFINSLSNLEDRITTRDVNAVSYSFSVDNSGTYQPVIEKFKFEDFGLKVAGNLSVNIDGKAAILLYEKDDDSLVYYEPIVLGEGEHRLTFKIVNVNSVDGGDFENESNLKFIGSGTAEIVQDFMGNHFLKTVNMGHEIDPPGAVFRIKDFDPRFNYLVQFRYRQAYGHMTAIGINQFRKSGMVKSYFERFPAIPDWQDSSFYFTPVVTLSDSEIKLIAPVASKDFGTTVYYDDLTVSKVFSNDLFFVSGEGTKISTPDISFVKKSPVKYSGEVTNVKGPHTIVFSENYSPFWEIAVFDDSGEKINLSPSHFSANYYANAWYVDGISDGYKFVITYKLQQYMIVGLIISLAFIISLVIYSIIIKYKIIYAKDF